MARSRWTRPCVVQSAPSGPAVASMAASAWAGVASGSAARSSPRLPATNGRRHRRAAQRRISAAGPRGLRAAARRDIDPAGTVVREVVAMVGPVHRPDRDDAVEAGRIERGRDPAVARGRDHHDTALLGVDHGGSERRRRRRSAKRHVDDLRPVIGRPGDPRCERRVEPGAVGIEGLDRQDPAPPADPGAADPVATGRGDDPGHVRAVTVVVGRVAVAVDQVDAGQDAAGEIRVGGVDAGVDHGDDRSVRAGRCVPGRRGTDQRQSPLIRRPVERVVRFERGRGRPIDLDVADRRIRPQRALDRGGVGSRDAQPMDRETADRALVARAELRRQGGDAGTMPGPGADEQVDRRAGRGAREDGLRRLGGADARRSGQHPAEKGDHDRE